MLMGISKLKDEAEELKPIEDEISPGEQLYDSLINPISYKHLKSIKDAENTLFVFVESNFDNHEDFLEKHIKFLQKKTRVLNKYDFVYYVKENRAVCTKSKDFNNLYKTYYVSNKTLAKAALIDDFLFL